MRLDDHAARIPYGGCAPRYRSGARRVRLPHAVLAACGDDKQSAGSARDAAATGTPTAAATADPAADQKLADDAQLTLEDLPAGWKIVEQENDNRSNCEAVRSARGGRRGPAGSSPQFTLEGGTAIVKSAVYLYAGEGAAGETLRSLSADETRTCLSDEVTERVRRGSPRAAATSRSATHDRGRDRRRRRRGAA